MRLCVAILTSAVLALVALPAGAHAQACTPPASNPIVCENAQQGADPSTWEIEGAGDETIQGYATAMSVTPGQTIGFKIKSDTPNYKIDILRLGYYDGDGARLMQGDLAPTNTSAQPSCETFDTGLIDCGNWSVSRSWTVPSTAVSGVYIAHLKKNVGGGESHIVFVVRSDTSHSDVVVQTSDQTWQAYNAWGGNSLYVCSVDCPDGNPLAYKAAFKVSYNRPMNAAEDDGGRSWLFTGGEYQMIRFLEANGYDVSYISGLDSHSRGQLLLNHKLFISSGHDEYWSKEQRTNVETARDAGVDLAFFSGNEMYWKTRIEPSASGTPTADRTLVSYKDTHFNKRVDPVSWTGTWRDPRYIIASDGATPENALTGQSFTVNSGTSAIQVPAAFGKLRLWRHTDAASLGSGQTLALAPGTLGYEWDVDADNGFRPAGQIKLSSTTVPGVEVFTDYGSTVTTGPTVTHNLTMYKVASGARVFGAGTVQWAWGLDDSNPSGTPADKNMRQATVNLFADMGVQPATLTSNLTAVTQTTDTTAPTAVVTSPPGTVNDGQQVTLQGTASDVGGAVAGVEVSTDGGATWHPATGTTTWSYTWLAHGNPSTVIKARATDDSGNTGAATVGATINVNCPCSIWGTSMSVPTSDRDSGDPSSIEVGMKFRSDKFGTVSGVRFYKSAANTGTHTGSLWSATGERLAQATFGSETASGWQTVTFDSPVTIQPNTTYVVSYHAPNGHYSGTNDYFWATPAPGPNGGAIVSSPPLSAVRNEGTTLNGLFTYSATSAFPTNSHSGANYWVDAVFSPIPAPGQVTGVTATEGGLTSANVSWTAPATGGTVTSYKITPYIGAVAQTPRTVTGTPLQTTTSITGLTNGTTYTFRVEAVNPNGSGPVSAASNAVTPSTAVAPSIPLALTSHPASQSARVTWTAPESDGDSAITGYTVTPYIGAAAQTPVQAGASATSATVPGLTNGTSYTFRVRAINVAGTGPAAISPAAVPQATLLDFATPANVDAGDVHSVELGVKFKADYNGWVTGVRFYKSAANTGTHTGSLWALGGSSPLRQATFTNETASGWQSVTFSSPVAVTAGTTYVASYFAPNGHYSSTSGGLQSGLDNPPLHALTNVGNGNGVYTYTPSSAYPSSSYEGSNYFVDVLFAVPPPAQVTDVTAEEAGTTSANVEWSAPSSGGPVTGYRITPYVGATKQPSTTVSGTPAQTHKRITGLTTGTTYRFTVEALNANGSGGESAQSNAVTPSGPVAPVSPTDVAGRPASQSVRVSWTAPDSDGDSAITGYTITPYLGLQAQPTTQVSGATLATTITGLKNGLAYTFRVSATNAVGASPMSVASAAVMPEQTIFDFATPTIVDDGDNHSATLGVRFTTDFAGWVTGIRFYKSALNTGTHIGTLWNTAGGEITSATFTNETATGWQDVTFSTPVAVTPGTTYVASYFAPRGRYSATPGAFSSAVVNAPLRTLANSISGNGVFAYGASNAFPQSSFGATNYWVDVLFEPAPAPGVVPAVTATAGQSSATVSWTAPTAGGPATTYTVTPYIGTVAQTPKIVTGTPTAPTTTTISGLTGGTQYTFKVQGSNMSGAGPDSAASNAVTPTGAQPPAAPTGVSANGDSAAATVRWTAPASDGGSAITGYTVTPYIGTTAQTAVPAGASATSLRVTGLTDGTAYTFRVAAVSAVGTGTESTDSNAVTPRISILGSGTPATVDGGDTSSVNLGVKWRADVNGTVTGLRFYKAAANTGTHIGSLWPAGGGSPLGQATFTDETASGWQSVTFTTPVAVTAGTTYVASYLAPSGHYSASSNAFAAEVANTPLRALANSVSQNGVFAYGSSPVFPNESWNATNYWVDVLFAPAA